MIRNNPAPGTPAFAAKQQRDKAKGKLPAAELDADTAAPQAETPGAVVDRRPAQRQQPKKQTRNQRKSGGSAGPSGRSSG